VLGPKLYDISKVSKILKIAETASEYNENKINSLKKWFDDNRLSFNLTKTKFIIFSNRQ